MFPSYEKWVFLTTCLFSSGAFFIMTRLNALNISCAQKFRVKDSFFVALTPICHEQGIYHLSKKTDNVDTVTK